MSARAESTAAGLYETGPAKATARSGRLERARRPNCRAGTGPQFQGAIGKLRGPVAGLLLGLAAAPALAAEVPDQPCDPAALPRYADFAVTPETLPTHPALKRNNRFARKYRTRLGDGLRDLPVNFAGHYVMVTWGCGTTCLDGGMVDARTGQATALPFLLDSFGSLEVDIADPLLYRADSRLVIMLGMLREEDGIPRQYFYEWTHGRLNPLCHASITEKAS